jgi:glutathione S-transferase
VTLTLYDAPRCPYCARVRITLAEKGVAYEVVEIDLDDRPDWIKAINPPDGRVPVLEEDGVVIPESVVLNEFLEDRYPEPALLPADHAERAFARLQIERFSALGDPYYATRRGAPGAREELEAVFADLDAMLAQVTWLTGRSYGLADIAYVPWALRARHLLGVSFEALPAFGAWLERMLSRPAIAAEAEIVSTLPRLV